MITGYELDPDMLWFFGHAKQSEAPKERHTKLTPAQIQYRKEYMAAYPEKRKEYNRRSYLKHREQRLKEKREKFAMLKARMEHEPGRI